MDMDLPARNKGQPDVAAPAAAEAAKKKPTTTLLDAYEVDCIRRELERLILKQNQLKAAGAAAPTDAHDHHHRCHHRGGSKKPTSGGKKNSPSPAPAPPVKKNRRGVRLLGSHAVALCSGTVPVSGAAVGEGGGTRRRGGYREVEKV
ncbi:hypothetical protein ACP70R_042617 [Stipagrostis hirtigluma subsp. patula]